MHDGTEVIATYDNYDFSRPIEYIFNMIFSIYGISYRIIRFDRFNRAEYDLNKTLVVSYGKKYLNTGVRSQIHIYTSDLFGGNYLKPYSMPKVPPKRHGELPVIYDGRGEFDDFVRRSGNLIETNIDIIASSFFMLSRYEEIVLREKDRFDRFPATESLAYKGGFLDRPVVNEYIELLWSWIDGLGLGLKTRELWRDKDFAVCLTHDVDNVRKYGVYPPLLTVGRSIVRDRDLRRASAIIMDYLEAKLDKKLNNAFSYMMKLESKYGFKSSFYFMSGGSTKYDASYSIHDSDVISLLRTLRKEGFEIGLHPSFDSYEDFDMVNLEKQKLEKATENPIFGGRQHYLRWKTPDTWRILEKVGLKYDTTLSFADHEGFRCGICLPYEPFDILQNRRLDIWELPLTVMDRSLFDYQNLTPEEGFQRIKDLIDITKDYHGMFVLLWHNSSLDPLRFPGWAEVYKRIIEYLGKKNILKGSAREIIDWWEKNKPA